MRKSICRLTLGIILPLLLSPAGGTQTAPSPSALAKLSDKDLFKRADAEDKAGRLDSAREAILLAIQKKKKPDPKYQGLLDSLNSRIADREAAAGEAACGHMDLGTCQKQIAVAKKYAATTKVNQLEANFIGIVAKLKQDYQTAVNLAKFGDPETALDRLAVLVKFEAFLPDIKNEIVNAQNLLQQKRLEEGRGFIAAKRWEDASLIFQRVLTASPNNAEAKAGIDKLDRGRKAYSLSSQAAEQMKAKRYEVAFTAINGAIATYPEAKDEFNQSRKQITAQWISYLLEEIPSLVSFKDDWDKSRESYLRLQQVQELDSQNAEVPKYIEEARKIFALNSATHAQKLAEIQDLSRIATATVLRFEVQRLMPELVAPEELKNVMTNFNKKRVSQLVLSVEDLASASPDFTQSIQARTRSIIDKQGLRDLRVRTKDDYEKSPNDDVQFQYLLPDGKSYTALLTANITKYEFRRQSQSGSPDVKSRFVFGSEKVPNPEYETLLKHLDEMRKSLDSPGTKKGKPTKEGWTEQGYQQKLRELERTDKLIDRDKIVDYTYQRIEYKQNTEIEIEVTLRDYYSKDVIAQNKIPYHDERSGVEITGVKDRDVGGLQNQPLRLPDKDQALAEGARTVREALDQQIPKMLQTYTNRFFNEGEKELKASHMDEAVEAYLCHWAFFGGKLGPEQTERIAAVIRNATGFDLGKSGDKLMGQLLTVMVVQ